MTDPNAQPPHEPPAGPPAQPGQPVPPQQGQQVPPQQGQVPPQQGQPGQPYAPQPGQPGQPYGQQPGQPYGQQPGQPAPAGAPLSPADDKQWAMFAHFGGILSILPSLIIFLVFKDRGAFTRQESKEALNWQITVLGSMIILAIVGVILAFILALMGLGFIGSLLMQLPWVIYVANVIFSILGGVKVKDGQAYRYPIALRLIK